MMFQAVLLLNGNFVRTKICPMGETKIEKQQEGQIDICLHVAYFLQVICWLLSGLETVCNPYLDYSSDTMTVF